MGNSIFKMVVVLVAGGLVSSAKAEENKILQRLEKGEIISSKTGSSFFVQALVNKDIDKVQAAFADLSKLPSVFPQIAFARPYVGPAPENRKFLYLKLRGLGDGMSILTEVKSGGGDAFNNARELVLSADYGSSRNSTSEVDPAKEDNELKLRKDVDESNANATSGKLLGIPSGLILEGPLNEVMELPNVRMTVNLGYSSYMEMPLMKFDSKSLLMPAPAITRKTYLVAKVSFGNQAAKGELGDYRGFGDRRLSLAEQVGVSALSVLKGSLEK